MDRFPDDDDGNNIATMAKPKAVLKRPPMYTCVFVNDDYTPMAFVVEMLISIFNQRLTDAEAIMLKVHKEGKASVGVYPKDIAIHKADETISVARKREYPLQVIPTPI